MTFLLAFLTKHIVAIAMIGTVAGTVASLETLYINTDAIIEKHQSKEQK